MPGHEGRGSSAANSPSTASGSAKTNSGDSSTESSGATAADDGDDDLNLTSDVLGIYTGPEADAVLGRSHARWQAAVRAARAARPGEFPDSAFDLEGLLLRIPALPDSIPTNAAYLEGYSTWTNTDMSCSLREKRENPHGVRLKSLRPFTITTSFATSFQVWDGTANNGVALLILGWAYILNATLAEKQNLPLQVTNLAPTASSSTLVALDFSYATPEELAWWRVLTTQGTALCTGPGGKFLPWSLIVADLGDLDFIRLRNDCPSSHELPSASQAAVYLARFSSAYDLGSQCSAALAAVLCFRIHGETQSKTLSVPKPRFSSTPLAQVTSTERPREFDHLSYYMTLALSDHALPVVLESLLWEPDVSCNHAGQWLRPIRNVLGPIVEAKDRELFAKAIAFSSAKAAPLWLGTLLCGEYPNLLNSINWYHWYGRRTLDAASWTGIARSFLALPSPGPYMRDGVISRSDVWRLRRDLRDSYDKYEDDYTLEPLGPFCPFGTMEFEDIEIELHDHLRCSHQWAYKHWTWLYNSVIDVGFSPTGGPLPPLLQLSTETPAQLAHYVEQYRDRADAEAIGRISRLSAEWTFKWCGNQVEKGFTGHIVSPCHCSQVPVRSEDSIDNSVDRAEIYDWAEEVDTVVDAEVETESEAESIY